MTKKRSHTELDDNEAAIVFRADGDISIMIPEACLDKDGMPIDGLLPDHVVSTMEAFFAIMGVDPDKLIERQGMN